MPDTELHLQTAARDVVAWRRRQLVEAGFQPGLAACVAGDPQFDLHALIELAERGCPPALAARILAPLEGSGARP